MEEKSSYQPMGAGENSVWQDNQYGNLPEAEIPLGDSFRNENKASENDKHGTIDYEEGFTNGGSDAGPTEFELDMSSDDKTETSQLETATGSQYTNFSDLLRDLGQEAKMVMLQYSQTFGESEAYEQKVVEAFDNLELHATQLEKEMKATKRRFHGDLSQILNFLSDD